MTPDCCAANPGPKAACPLKPYLIAGATYAVLLVLLFREAFFLRQFFYRGNLLLHALPNGEFGAQWLGKGVLPLWNPYTFCGYPWLADPLNAVFYPLHMVLFVVAGGAVAINLEILLHFWLAGMFMFAFVRGQGRSVSAALAAGSVFMLNGFLVDYYDQLEGLRTMVWLPLLLLCVQRGAGARSCRWALLAGIVLGVQFHGGHFQYATYNTLLAFAYFLFVEVRTDEFRWKSDWTKLIGRWTIICAVGVGLFAVQLLPTYELTQLSARSRMPLSKVLANQDDLLSLSLLVKFIAPTLDGGPVDDVQPVYIGIVAVLVALLSLGSRRRGEVAFFLGVVVACILLMAGPLFPGYMLLYKVVPGFKFFKDPLRFVFPALVACAILVGYGVDAFLGAPREQRESWAAKLGLVWLILFLLILLAYVPRLYLGDLPWDGRGVLALPRFRFFVRDALTCLTGLVLVVWLLFAGKRLSDRALGAGVVALLAASLFPFGGLVAVELAPASIHEPDPELLKALRGTGASGRVFVHPMLIDLFYDYEYHREMKTMGLVEEVEDWRNDGLLGATPAKYGISAASGFSVYPLVAFVAETNAQKFDPERHSLSPAGGTEFLKHDGGLWGLGCSWILMPAVHPLSDDLVDQWKLVKSTPQVLAYYNPSVRAWPRTSSTYFRTGKTGNGDVGERTQDVWDRIDYVTEFSQHTWKSPDHLWISGEGCRDLSPRQASYPGWRAWASGSSCEVGTTRRLMQNVRIEARGPLQLDLVFESFAFRLGLAVTALTLAVLCAALGRCLAVWRSADR